MPRFFNVVESSGCWLYSTLANMRTPGASCPTGRTSTQFIANLRALQLLSGTSVGDIPIEEPTKFELVIDHRSADAIGVRLSPDLSVSTDQVIEYVQRMSPFGTKQT
jgi:hypothetical protein